MFLSVDIAIIAVSKELEGAQSCSKMKNIIQFNSLKNRFLLITVFVAVVVFVTTVFTGRYFAQKRELQLSEQFLYSASGRYASHVRSILQKGISAAKTLANTYAENYDASSPLKLSNEQISRINKATIERNRSFAGIKIVLDPLPSTIKKTNAPNTEVIPDSNFFEQLDEIRFRANKNAAVTLKYWFATEQDGFRSIKTMKPDDYENKEYYLVVKKTLQPYISTPYTIKIQDKKYELISISTPVIYQNIFYGIVVIEIPVDAFREIVDNDDLISKKQVLTLITENNTIVATTGKPFLSSKDISKLYRNVVINNMDKKGVFEYNNDNDVTLHSTSNIQFQDVFSNWRVHLEISKAQLNTAFRQHIFIIVELVIIVVLLLSIVAYFALSYFFKPISHLQELSKSIALGDLSEDIKIKETGIEIKKLKQSIIEIKTGLRKISEFAKKIGQGEFDVDFTPRSDKDELGISLLKMKDSLKIARDEEDKRKEENEVRFWTSHGITQFSELLRKYNSDFEKLTYHVIVKLVEYLEVNQGGVFTINDKDENDIYLEMISAFAYNRKKHLDRKIYLNEGLAGACAREKKTMYITNIPDDYIEITSGLGDARPNYLLLVPLISEDKIMGVIELASFKTIEKHKISFVEKVGEGIASTLSSVRVANETNRLLEQSREQTEAMTAQEEELRQNIEELQATKEEMDRQNTEFYKRMNLYIQVLDAVPYYISVTDRDLNWIFMNKELAQNLGVDRDDMDTQKCSYFGADVCKTNNCAVHKLKFEGVHEAILNKSGRRYLAHTNYIYDDKGEAIGHVEIMTDITNRVNTEQHITQMVNEMRSLLTAVYQSTLLFELDLDASIENASEMMERKLGYSNEEIIGIQFSSLLAKEDVPKFEKFFKRVSRGKNVSEIFEFLMKENDKKITVRLYFSPIKNDEETIIRILIIGNTIE